MESPKTLVEAIAKFSDPDVAREFVVRLRWPNGVACPREGCGNADVQWIATRKLWRCKECKRQFTAKVGTIFEDSPVGFEKWLPAMWLLSSARNGISSCELARALGVTQKTAWFMLHRIRYAMKNRTFSKMYGPVEVDETFIGGRLRDNTPTGSRGRRPGPTGNKAIVMGIVQRKGEVRAFTVPNVKRGTLLPKLHDNVAFGSTVYSDALKSYSDARNNYSHMVINHAEEYARGLVHTNTIENFWSCLKRTLGGTYICARPQHLDAYLDEQIFRFNSRTDSDGYRFQKMVVRADGKRLTYRALIRKP